MIFSLVLAVGFWPIQAAASVSSPQQPGQESASQVAQVLAAADQASADAMKLYAQKTPAAVRQGMEKSQAALALYQQAGDRPKQAEQLVILGSASLSIGDKPKAVEYIRSGLDIVRSLGHRNDEAVVTGMLAGAYEMAQQREAASENYAQQLALCRELNNIQCQGSALMGLGRVAFAELEKEQALDYFRQAIPIWRVLGDRKDLASATYMAGSLNDLLIRKQDAIPYYLEALSTYRDLGDRFWEARVLMDVAQDYAASGNEAKAGSYYDLAIPALQASKDQSQEATALVGRALLLEGWGQMEKAIADLKAAQDLFHAEGNRIMEATILVRMGIVCYESGEQEKALATYRQSLQVARSTSNTGLQAASLNGIGSIYLVLGDETSALRYTDEASKLMPIDASGVVDPDVLFRLGVTYTSLKENEKATAYFSRAVQAYDAKGDQVGKARALHALAGMYDIAGQSKQALVLYAQALKIRQGTADQRSIADSLTAVGTMYSVLKQPDHALDCYRQALEIYRSLHDPVGESKPLFWMAKTEQVTGHLESARDHIEQALSIAESQRSSIASPELRTTYLSTAQYAYELYVDVLMQLNKLHPNQGYDAKALEAHEAAKARGLLDLLSEARVNFREGIDPELLQQELQSRQRLEDKQSEEIRLLAGGESGDELRHVQKELEALRVEYQQVEAQIRSQSPHYAAVTQPRSLNLAAIQKQVLDTGTVLLEYALGEPRSYLWAVTSSGLHSFELPDRSEIEKPALRLYRTITGRRPGAQENYQDIARALSGILLGPAQPLIANKRLVIVPDGVLQIVPFAALPSPGVEGYEPLILRHELVDAPSASTIALLRRDAAERSLAPKKIAVFADPVFDKDDPRVTKPRSVTAQASPTTASVAGELPSPSNLLGLERLSASRREAETILRMVPASSRLAALDFEANRREATAPNLDRYQIIHFATHGVVNDAHPELSGIVLSLVDKEGNPQDGFLRLNDLFNLHLDANLVVLSACKTALGREVRGEGLIGLARGFMYAGTPRVVTSLWSVNDQATAEEMELFYSGMLGRWHLRPAAALQRAQMEMWKQEKWRSPFLWAAFVLQGDWK